MYDWILNMPVKNTRTATMTTVSLLSLMSTLVVTAYLSGYTGLICLRLSLYFQHIKKLLQNKKGNINITMYK